METRSTMAIGTQTYSCPYCHDTGWEIKKEPSALYYGPSFKDWPDIDMAYPCSHCGGKGMVREIEFPKEFSEVDITHFNWQEYGQDMSHAEEIVNTFWNNYSAWARTGMGLYIWSKTRGSGKTFLACCLGRSVQAKYGISVKFTTSVDYLEAVSESYREENRGRDDTQKYRDCELLILDDLGAENRSRSNNWTDKEFFRLLGGRFSQGKVTIITSNVHLSELNIDERVSSRINAKSVILQLPEISIRQRKAEQTKKDFIKRLVEI